MAKSAEATPMVRQFLEIKANYSEAFLFFRMGDFYELFFEDAKKAAKILGVALTQRGSHQGEPIPMCGVPYHSVDAYLGKMMAANCKVAICEQVEDPKMTKGLVKRKVVRVVTPGTLMDDSLLSAKESNYLAAVSQIGALYGFAYVELSTGEFQVTEVDGLKGLDREISRIRPAELILPKSMSELELDMEAFENFKQNCHFQSDWIFDYKRSLTALISHFKTHSLDGYGLKNSIAAVCAAGAVHYYVETNCSQSLDHLKGLKSYDVSSIMALDEPTKRNLELLKDYNNKQATTIIDVLDDTLSPMGARLIRNWIHAPLKDLKAITQRQECVENLKRQYEPLLNVRHELNKMLDMERIMARVVCGSASPRDMLSLVTSVKQLPKLRDLLGSFETDLIISFQNDFGDFDGLVELIEATIDVNCPNTLKDGGVICKGHHQELDELRQLSTNAKVVLSEIQQREAEKTKIKNLKIKFNNVFGYYLEVSKAQTELVPDYFIRKQTLVNAERYITPELKELESKILGAEQKSVALETELFAEVRNKVAKFSEEVKVASSAVAQLDALCSFAICATKYGYVRPILDKSSDIEIVDGRHPVVETLMSEGEFITNDTTMDTNQNQIILITGPNMAGKSTYLRQTALIVLLAQIGCQVPAKEARIGLVDRIFTRVGAFDDQSSGKSTFMVEMNETANILNNATEKSLIILDEIGRGTSTYDGISIAWAVIEYLSYESAVKARTLFATHYHELTVLETKIEGVKNFNISVREWNEKIMFLRKIVRGAADKSYGIQVARLAGLPGDVVNRAKEILLDLESGKSPILADFSPNKPSDTTKDFQLDLFNAVPPGMSPDVKMFLESLKSLDVMNTTPLNALANLNDLVTEAGRILQLEEIKSENPLHGTSN